MAEVLKTNNMKKESSFKLKSGNDLGRSATKLMKQSPARAEDKGIHEGTIHDDFLKSIGVRQF